MMPPDLEAEIAPAIDEIARLARVAPEDAPAFRDAVKRLWLTGARWGIRAQAVAAPLLGDMSGVCDDA